MSAIVGIYNLDGRPVASADLDHMVESMAFRGPDGSQIWNEGPAGFGHLMLHTTPESLHETLPLIDKTRDLALTADARIDNRDELSEALELSAEVSRGMSDSEFVLAAYIRWGEECPKHLLGDFAFAIWDGQQQKLFCARDHFGVKAFYYFHAPGKLFAFATQIKAILTLEGIPRHLNETRIAGHLSGPPHNSTDTFYTEIFRLAPAHTLSLRASGLRMEEYWMLDVTRKTTLGSDAEYAQKFREIFEEAVRCRMRSVVPLGTMLSGGIDSSSITCMARHLRQQEESRIAKMGASEAEPLPTFSAVFDVVTKCDEREFIQPVLDQGGFDSTFMVADSVSPLKDHERVSNHQDEPLNAGNLYINWEIYKLAEAKGVRVLLDGFDGDTTVSHGLGYFVELACERRWLKLRLEVYAFARKVGESGNKAFWVWLTDYGITPFVSKHLVLRTVRKVWLGLKRRLRRNNNAKFAPPVFLNPDFLERTKKARQIAAPLAPTTEREVHYRRLTKDLLSDILEILDKSAAPFGIELRFPFCDVRLAEYCLSLPPEQKLQQGWSRLVMRRAMDGILPSEVQWRNGKANLSSSFIRGLLKFERLKLDEIINHRLTRVEKYVNVIAVRQAYSKYVAGVASEEDVMQIWQSVSLALWLQSCHVPS